MDQKKIHYYGLDLLRFFAAFWVMSFHYFLGLSGELSWYRYGNLGVPLFFIISGFVISQSVSTSTVKQFILGRWIRLFPLFWILCTSTYIFTLLIPNGNPVHFSEYLVSMSMLGDKFGAVFHLPRLVDPVYWSLAVELIFYVMIAFFVYLFTWKKIRFFLWGWLIVSILSFLLHIDQNFIMKTLLVRHASYFIFGAVVSLIITNNTKTILEKYSDYSLIIFTAIYSTYISYRALPPYFVPHSLDTHFVTFFHPIFFIVFIGLLYLSKKIHSKKFETFCIILGGITYPLYLIHQTVGIILIEYFDNYGTLVIRGTIMMIIAISISYYAYFYDKKLRKFLTLKLLPKNKSIL